MIKTFAHKRLENFFYDAKSKGLNKEHCKKIARILDRLDSSESILDMEYPGAGLHKLAPKKDNRWAVKISGNWRITFVFEKGNAYEIDYCDYH